MQLVCYVGIAAEFRWVCAECQQRGFSNYRADQPAAWGTGISTFAISAGLSGSGSKPSVVAFAIAEQSELLGSRPPPSDSLRRFWDALEEGAGPDQLDEEKERPSEPTPEPTNLRAARLEPDFRVNEQHDAFTSELRSNCCYFDTYIIHTGLEGQARACWRPFPYPRPFIQLRNQIPVNMGLVVAGLRQCRIRNRHFRCIRRCLEKNFSAGLRKLQTTRGAR
jgi:hypothetical protein